MKKLLLSLALASVLVFPFVSDAKVNAHSGATAKCRDGTYSYSLHRQGTCSHHRGVAYWINY